MDVYMYGERFERLIAKALRLEFLLLDIFLHCLKFLNKCVLLK